MAIYTLDEILQKTGAKPEDIKLESATGVETSTPSKESVFTKIKNGLKSLGGAIISSEKGFGESIAGALPSSIPGSAGYQENKLQQQRTEEQQLFAEQLAGLQKLKALGKDTTKLEQYLSEAIGKDTTNLSSIVPSVNKTPGQVLGEGFGVALDIATAGAGGQVAKDTIKTGAKTLGKNIAKGAGIGYGYDVTQGLQNKEGAKSFIPGTGTIVGGGLPVIGSLAKKGVTKAGELSKKMVNNFIDTINPSTVNASNQLITTTRNIGKGVKNFVGQSLENLKQIPSNISTNIAEKQAVRESIKELPKATYKNAVLSGVDINDVKSLSALKSQQAKQIKPLIESVQKFASGESKVNPIEIVGKPIVNRIKELETKKLNIGKKLGEVSKQLGDVSEAESVFPIYDKLKQVPGLSGLRFSETGGLDFSNTVLASAETASDRRAITRIFDEATRASSGEQKHLLRQELFESLGGKKKAGVQLTGTQEKAYEAIRSGLSDILDSKNSQYKKLNDEYRKIVQPLNGIYKFVKTGDENIANLSAGLIARRLTSASQSNPTVRSVLKALDNATKITGKSRISTETLQDVYNILNKYYDIAPKTGFQNLVKEGVSNTGVIGKVSEAVGSLVGKTNAVRQKALENLLNDIFK